MSYNPYREIVKRIVSERHRVIQPVPDVSEEDVSRIVRRDFPERFDSVMTVLNEYGNEKWERGQARVRLAALKLARGNLERLKKGIEAAKRDFRDVIAAAEYPEYFGEAPSAEMSMKEKKRMIDRDSKQYETWQKDKGRIMKRHEEELQCMLDIDAQADAREGIRLGLEDARKGRTRPAEEFFREFERIVTASNTSPDSQSQCPARGEARAGRRRQ